MKWTHVAAALAASALIVTVAFGALTAAPKVVVPDPALDDALAKTSGKATMVVAGGCFWGIEELYQHVRGVTGAVSGYAGGSKRNANYELVSTGTTGHAESVQVTYDPSKITYGQLLKIFWSVAHDPTQRGGQGPDAGPQYRSVIFYAGERQQQIAKAYVDQLTAAKVFPKAITTQIAPLAEFYEAEPYHQEYASHHPNEPYIMMNDRPKVEALRVEFPQVFVK